VSSTCLPSSTGQYFYFRIETLSAKFPGTFQHPLGRQDERLTSVLPSSVNISNAAIFGLQKDLDIVTGTKYNTALTIFFVPYVLFEVWFESRGEIQTVCYLGIKSND
jgi:hypothetical protein